MEIYSGKEYVREGKRSLALSYTLSGELSFNVIDFNAGIDGKDFSSMKEISLWIYGNNDRNVYLQVGLSGGENGYYVSDIGFIDWEGWKKIVLPKKSFYYVGSFADWEYIDTFFIRVNGEIAAREGKVKDENSGTLYVDDILRVD